jgi:uncharacterized protein YeaO (DUF488 family)
VSIARQAPAGYTGLEYKTLAPTWDILSEYKQTKDERTYIQQYNYQLFLLSADHVVKELKELAQSDQIILLCYEKPDDFCHRHLVAQWLTEHGYDTQEIEFNGN